MRGLRQVGGHEGAKTGRRAGGGLRQDGGDRQGQAGGDLKQEGGARGDGLDRKEERDKDRQEGPEDRIGRERQGQAGGARGQDRKRETRTGRRGPRTG